MNNNRDREAERYSIENNIENVGEVSRSHKENEVKVINLGSNHNDISILNH